MFRLLRLFLWGGLCVALFFSPVKAGGRTDARCGLSAGAVAGVSVPRDLELKDEFIYLYHIEANAKYYFLKVFSVSGDLGYEYGQGAPKHFYYENESQDLDSRGRSFWRALQTRGTLRIEVFRNFVFNPYLGGGGGYKYLLIERKGLQRQIPISDSGEEWLPSWMALAGFDIMINDFFSLRVEGRYTSSPSTEKFFEDKDMGAYDALAGINIYF